MRDASSSASNAANTTQEMHESALTTAQSASSVSDATGTTAEGLDSICDLVCPERLEHPIIELEQQERNADDLAANLLDMSLESSQNSEDLDEMRDNFEEMSHSVNQIRGQLDPVANASDYPVNTVTMGLLA